MRLLRDTLFFILLSFSFLSLSALGALTNNTIDDTDGAFTWSPGWTAVTPSDPCNFCASKPDTSQTVGGSWHDGNTASDNSGETTGSFTFTGSAVYIYGIDQANSQPEIVFTVSGTSRADTHHYTGTERFVYHALFFSATDLPAGQSHTVNWVFNFDSSTGKGIQAALFDYAVVTSGTEDSTSTGSSSGSTSGSSSGTATGGSTGSTDSGSTSSGSTSGSTSSSDPSTESSSSESSSAGNTNSNIGSGAQAASGPAGSVSAGSSNVSGTSTASAKSSGNSSTPAASSGPAASHSGSATGALGAAAGTATSSASGTPQSASGSGSTKSKSHTGVIVGAVIGALVLVALAGIAFRVWLTRRRRRLPPAAGQITPMTIADRAEETGLAGPSVPARGWRPRPFKSRLDGQTTATAIAVGAAADTQPQTGPSTTPTGHRDEKTYDVLWNIPELGASGNPDTSPTSESSPPPTSRRNRSLSPSASDFLSRSGSDLTRSGTGTGTTRSRSRRTGSTRSSARERERMLEERVAQLEARVALATATAETQPPPYSGRGEAPQRESSGDAGGETE